jgi:hypothetical protein
MMPRFDPVLTTRGPAVKLFLSERLTKQYLLLLLLSRCRGCAFSTPTASSPCLLPLARDFRGVTFFLPPSPPWLGSFSTRYNAHNTVSSNSKHDTTHYSFDLRLVTSDLLRSCSGQRFLRALSHPFPSTYTLSLSLSLSPSLPLRLRLSICFLIISSISSNMCKKKPTTSYLLILLFIAQSSLLLLHPLYKYFALIKSKYAANLKTLIA